MFAKPIACLVGLAVSTTALWADDRVDTNLLSKGDWTVNKVAFPSDPIMDTCLAETRNDYQSLILYGYTGDWLQVLVADARWDMGDRTVQFVVSTKTFSQTVDGTASGTNLSFDLPDRGAALALMDAIARDLVLSVTTAAGKKIGDFSLRGSHASMAAFEPCWAGIQEGSAAPALASSADPFDDSLQPYYFQPLEDGTEQTWLVENEFYNDNGHWGVDIRGEGPLGEFVGNLGVSCLPVPSWDWARSYLGAASVPEEALQALTQYVCRDS